MENENENENIIGDENLRDPFEFLSSTFEEGKEELSYIDTSRGVVDHRICVCGHPVKRHKMNRETHIIACQPNAQPCPCKRRNAVLKSEDLRFFLRATRGEGWLHALGQGILTAQERGVKLDWLVPAVCELCKKPAKVMPASLNERFKADIMSGMNYLICDECRLTI